MCAVTHSIDAKLTTTDAVTRRTGRVVNKYGNGTLDIDGSREECEVPTMVEEEARHALRSQPVAKRDRLLRLFYHLIKGLEMSGGAGRRRENVDWTGRPGRERSW